MATRSASLVAARWCRIPSPLGVCVAWFTENGLLRLVLPSKPNEAELLMLPTATHAETGREAAFARLLLGELGEYFAGQRRGFTVPVELSAVSGFFARVLSELCKVPYGAVVTYGQLAALAGKPKAARAVGAAMRNNPVPIVVPCHRVVAANGDIGGFTPGLEIKRRLLGVEGHVYLR